MNTKSITAWLSVARVEHSAGRWVEAESAYRAALELDPGNVEALCGLTTALDRLGRHDHAAEVFRSAIERRPDLADLRFNLGSVLRHAGRNEEAVAAYREAIRLEPGRADAAMYLAIALRDLGHWEAARASALRAVELNSSSPQAWHNLGNIERDLQHLTQAVEAHRKAIALQPAAPEPYFGLGNDLTDAALFSQAADAFSAVIQRRPDDAQAWDHLGIVLHAQGSMNDAQIAFDRAIAIRSDLHLTHGNRLYALHGTSGARAISTEHLAWGRAVAAKTKRFTSYENNRDPNRRLRIGYVSGDFREHPVGRFMLPILEFHDRSAFEIVCYYNHVTETKLTLDLRRHADEWHVIFAKPDEAVAEQIHRDRIDILIDLAGHTGRNRLMVFARKPAPLQMTYLGYPNTTGLSAIDYRLTDERSDPTGETDALYSEKLIRLPGGFSAYPFPADALFASRAPALQAGHITFGSFNKLHKIVPQSLEVWSKILAAVPGSKLMLKTDGLGDPLIRERIERFFNQRGIAANRLRLLPATLSYADHLAAYDNIDIALDSFPYNGTTTTCEALSRGVPVIALMGDSHVSRVGTSLLTHGGFPQWIAKSQADYVDLAVKLAADPQTLAKVRASMPTQLTGSSLGDRGRLTAEIERAFRAAWRKWCAE